MAKIECSNRLRVILAEKEITNRWLAEQMCYHEENMQGKCFFERKQIR